jgi:hypothetical protein
MQINLSAFFIFLSDALLSQSRISLLLNFRPGAPLTGKSRGERKETTKKNFAWLPLWRSVTYLCPGLGIEDDIGLSCELAKAVPPWLLDFDTDLRVWELVTQRADAL